jgi:hypothetical protein
MDGTRFDEVVKRLANTRLTRLRALQCLAAATAVSLTGVSLATEETKAARRRRTICHCGDNNPEQINCVTKRLSRRRARRHLRNHEDDYKGKCVKKPTPVVGCSPADDTQGTCPAGQICSKRAICVAGCTGISGTRGSCPAGQFCIDGQCQNQVVDCSPADNTQGTCPAGQICTPESVCVPGCTGGPGQGSCPSGLQCRNGQCA